MCQCTRNVALTHWIFSARRINIGTLSKHIAAILGLHIFPWYTEGYHRKYASKDYRNFGHPINDLIGELNGHAPEIVTVDGKDYIACAAINATDGKEVYPGGQPAQTNIAGVYIQELRWVPQSQAEWLKLPESESSDAGN